MVAPLTDMTPAVAYDRSASSATRPAPGVASFPEIFRKHGRFVYRALRYLGVSPDDLDDVFQEVFVIVHRKLPEFEARSDLRTWLYGIAMRVASEHRRSSMIRSKKTSTVLEKPPRVLPSGASGAEARDLLRKALARLDAAKREVAVLYRIEGFTMQEVATILDIPLQTAYTRWHAAREQMVRFISRSGGTQ